MRLHDKVALVTGASQGIGAAIAKRYAREGAKVAVNYNRSADNAAQIVADIRDQGGAAESFQADCSQVPAINDLVARVRDTYGPIDILVNNAGLFHTVSIEDTTEEIWDAQLDLNLKGAFFLTKAVVPEMKQRGGGKIINISSIFGTGAGPNCPAYCASKGGVVNLTKALATELSKDQINVNSLAPGNIATPLNAHLQADPEYRKLMQTLTPSGVDFIDPEDLTGTAVYLASDDAKMVHGVTLLVDAGWSAW